MKIHKKFGRGGFTLIELIVAIAIIATLSGIILFSVSQYINKGKDSNIAGNLAVLIPAGEVFYNGNGDSYEGFCDPNKNSVIKNALAQIPKVEDLICLEGLTPGICCNVAPTNDAWAACAAEFTNNKAFCVDSRGVKEIIEKDECTNLITECPEL